MARQASFRYFGSKLKLHLFLRTELLYFVVVSGFGEISNRNMENPVIKI